MEGKKNKLALNYVVHQPSLSFWQAAWKRLRRNKAALAGLFLILLSLVLALFGYFLAPDPSPYANRIILEIGGRKPGFEQRFLLVKKVQNEKTSLLQQALYGKPDRF